MPLYPSMAQLPIIPQVLGNYALEERTQQNSSQHLNASMKPRSTDLALRKQPSACASALQPPRNRRGVAAHGSDWDDWLTMRGKGHGDSGEAVARQLLKYSIGTVWILLWSGLHDLGCAMHVRKQPGC